MSSSESISPGLSRRRLLFSSGTAASAAAVAAMSGPSRALAQDATPMATPTGGVPGSALVSTKMPTTWDREVDVVIVGTGAAAFAAAVTAKQGGADVVMLERAANAGGTTLISGSEYWIPNNSKMIAAGKTDPKDDALKYM